MYVDHHCMHKTSDYIFEETDSTLCDSINQDWLDDKESQAAISAIHISNKRRTLSVSQSKSRLQITGNFEEVGLHTCARQVLIITAYILLLS